MLIPVIVLGPFFLAMLLLSIPVDLAFSYEKGEGSRSRMRSGGEMMKEIRSDTH